MRAWMIVAMCGCGRVGFEPATGQTIDGGGGSCVWGPWGPVVPIAELTGSDPEEREDGLEMFLVVQGSSNYEIRSSTRTALTEQYPTPLAVTELNSAGNNVDPSLTADGLEIFYVSDRSGTSRAYHARRSTIAAAFGAPTLVAGLELEEVHSLDITPDGRTLYFQRIDDLYRVRRMAGDDFGTPERQIAAYSNTMFLTISSDELEVYYNAPPGYVTRTRTDPDQLFPDQATAVPDAGTDGDPDLSADGRVLLLAAPTLARRTRACQ